LDDIATHDYRPAPTIADLPISPGAESVDGLMDLADAAPVRIAAAAAADVLHVPYTYFPDPVGGTEVYVAGLAGALRARGIHSAVAAPGDAPDAYQYDGVPVFRFATERGADLGRAHGVPDPVAAQSFRALLAQLRPRIVHLHAHTAAVSEPLVEAAGAAGAKVVLTYHTPTVSCARGTMMWMGRAPCDGRLDRRRCTVCVLARHGVPPIVRDATALTPRVVADALGRARLDGGAFTALRLSSLIGAAHRRFADLADKVGRIVAPCAWVYEVLQRNRVPEEKLVLCRQGLPRAFPGSGISPRSDPQRENIPGELRLGYFGRLDPTKGVDIVVDALRRVPNAPVRLDIYGIRQPGCEAYAAKLERAADGDPRIVLRSALPPQAVDRAMRGCDLVIVPSRCLETGPLVVLEAFAAGTPVLGARLGGIAELVGDGIDGMLVPPEDPGAWAAAIAALADDPQRVAQLRAGIYPPRTMTDVADDMAELYQTLLADAGG
jgi:glycosyltransferase involved in cell wall biosynthesis